MQRTNFALHSLLSKLAYILLLLVCFFFLIPTALISAEFSSRYPIEGGVFHWVRHAFGDHIGLLAVWLQWINTIVWYPTMLLFISGTASYLIHPHLSSHSIFLLSTSLITFWGLTLINLKGIQLSAKINSFCGIVGTLLPISFLIVLGFWWYISHQHHPISFTVSQIFPLFNPSSSSNALVTILASLVGIELAGVHLNDIQNPQQNYPKAIAYSVVIPFFKNKIINLNE